MKYIFFSMLLCLSCGAFAQSRPVVEDCELSIAKAELGSDQTAYTRCGFDDEALAFSKWSGFVSQKQMKKAMYELCIRHPSHEYSQIYCQKSADLGYGPALAELGHRAIKEGLDEAALRYYARALSSKQLDTDQEGQVAQQLGMYYLQRGDHYAPAKAVAFLSAAALKRSALANNVMGYLSYTGDLGVKQDNKEAFTYFWRAILLDCPAAEENVGLFHLAHTQKITPQTAATYMEKSSATCTPTPLQVTSAGTVTAKPLECQCNEVLAIEGKNASKPYDLLEIKENKAKLRDKKGAMQTVQTGQALASGYKVEEVRQTVVILTKGMERLILNVMPKPECISYCQTQSSAGIKDNVQIKPYRITFTPNECQDILYYAKALVDTAKPFIGKEQCASETPLIEDPLLNLLNAPTMGSDENIGSSKSLDETTQKGGMVQTVPAKTTHPKGTTPPKSKKMPKFFQATVDITEKK